MKRVFIDGQAGTTGLEIKERLQGRTDIELVEIEEEKRKDPVRKKEILNSVDLTILCLPDGPARDTVSLIENDTTRVIDASTAHRVDPNWDYGFPELHKAYREQIATSKRVSNPGCHATGFIAGIYPLIQAGVIGKDYPVCATSITGFSGGGKGLIEKYQSVSEADKAKFAARPYALGLTHKHLPEMSTVCGLTAKPQFYPIVGDFERGMLVSMPLFTRMMDKKMNAAEVRELLAAHYEGQQFIDVKPFDLDASVEEGFLSAVDCNNTNKLELFVFGHDEQVTVVSRLDNLGKGASGAAVQNMNIMLGIDEATGL
jgi:N-acetyl-gamma-glutamyl-phosphate reductase